MRFFRNQSFSSARVKELMPGDLFRQDPRAAELVRLYDVALANFVRVSGLMTIVFAFRKCKVEWNP